MAPDSRHLSISIDRPAAYVYDYASSPADLPEWAAGLGSSVEEIDGEWVAESPMGRISVALEAPNQHGILDHTVRPPSGESVRNPMRVIVDGGGCEVVFTLRRQCGALPLRCHR